MPSPDLRAIGAAPALEMFDVTVTTLRDPSTVVLEGVSWRVEAGDYWAIGGLLRSGKSDLLAVAAGLMAPRCGVLRLLGREESGSGDRHPDLRQRIGIVFDGGHLLHHLTVSENIALPLLYHDRSTSHDESHTRLRVDALLRFVDLEDLGGRHPAQLNRNWQQRIGLARALALDPEVLLLDSPLTGLDPRDAAWWLNKLDGLRAGDGIAGGRPLTLVVTGDDLRPWRQRATQFAVLKNRQFIALGGRAGLAAHPEPLLRELLPEAAAGN